MITEVSAITKTDEIERINRFADEVSEYPYLGELMAEVAPLIITAIRNDMVCSSLSDLWKQKAEMEREIKAARIAAQEELNALRKECRSLKQAIDYHREEIDDIKRTAQRIACA